MSQARAKNFDSYKDTEILTANQGKLIVMLYEGAIRFLNNAIANMDHRTYDVVNTNIIKAQDIITELMLALNMEEGGEVAQNLFNLYAYMKKKLLEANMAKDVDGLNEIIKHLEQLRGAWTEVAGSDAAAAPEPAMNQRRQEGMSFSIQG